jgi:hypothetical protein
LASLVAQIPIASWRRHCDYIDDPERSECFVPNRWLNAVRLQDAFAEIALFGNQNTVCQSTTPKWRHTV